MFEKLTVFRYVPNHPKEDVLFQDIGPLLRFPRQLLDLLGAQMTLQNLGPFYFDCIVGLDARGFILGGMLSALVNRPLVMARKPGKLPEPKASVDYGLE